MRLIRRHIAAAVTGTLLLALLHAGAFAQDKKEERKKPDPPAVIVIAPLGVVPGEKVTLRIRGLRLSDAMNVRIEGLAEPLTIAPKEKGAAAPPNGQEASNVGDTQVVIEWTPPANLATNQSLHLAVESPAGVSEKRELVVVPADRSVQEKEPNDGFRSAQPVKVGDVVQGAIERVRDVDVFRFTGKAGGKASFETRAARLGSAVDAILAVYDASGRVLVVSDDAADHDAITKVTFPADGEYYVTLIDANDQGGPAHCYQFLVSAGE